MGHLGRTLAFVLGLSAGAPLLGGCAAHIAAAAAKAPKLAVPAAVNASLVSLEDPATRGRLAAIAGTPEMQQVIRDSAAEATRAALRAAADEVPGTLAPAVRTSIVAALGAQDMRDAVAMTASDATRASLWSSFDVLKQLHEEEGVPQLIGKLQHWLTAIVVGALVAGMAAGALLAWSLSIRRRSKDLAALLARREGS